MVAAAITTNYEIGYILKIIQVKDPHFFLDQYSNWQGVGQNVARDIAKGTAGKVDVHNKLKRALLMSGTGDTSRIIPNCSFLG